MAKKYPNLGKILKQLLFEKDMKPADLSREIDIPQPTIHRLITGKSTRPYKSSLKPIADYFGITIDQLIGDERLPNQQATSSEQSLINSNIHNIPLVPWERLENRDSEHKYEQLPFIGPISENGFAVQMPDSSMEPMFARGSILIFDPAKAPNDRSFVLIQLAENDTFIFRQLLIDADTKYIKSLNTDLQEHQIRIFNSADKIVGTLVESRTNFATI